MLVRNLSTVTLNLRKGGQKFVLQPGKATTIPEFLFSKEEVKAIYGHHVQVLNDSLEVLDATNVKKAARKPVIEDAPVEVEAVDEVVEEPVAEEVIEEITEAIVEEPVEEVVEDLPEPKEEAELAEALDAVLEEVTPVEVEEPKKAKRGGRKQTKKAE